MRELNRYFISQKSSNDIFDYLYDNALSMRMIAERFDNLSREMVRDYIHRYHSMTDYVKQQFESIFPFKLEFDKVSRYMFSQSEIYLIKRGFQDLKMSYVEFEKQHNLPHKSVTKWLNSDIGMPLVYKDLILNTLKLDFSIDNY